MKVRWAVALASMLTALPAAGQDVRAEPEDYWVHAIYPKVFYSTRNGLIAGGYFGLVQPLRFTQFLEPPPYRAILSVDAQVATRGSWLFRVDAKTPAMFDGWRFVGRLGARRGARENYFGIGNETEYDPDLVTEAQPHFYQADHVRFETRAEVQRRLAGPLRLLWGFDIQRWRLREKDGPSVLAQDQAAGADPRIGRFTTEVVGRVGVVVDTRNDEVQTKSGVLFQAIASGASDGFLGDASYSRLMTSLRGFLPVGSRVTLAGRALAQVTGGSPSIGTLLLVDNAEVQFEGLGGGASHRALPDQRHLGEHILLANFDVRYAIFEVPPALGLTLVGFVDAGRVFEGEPLRLTTDDMKVGGGGGLMIRLGRAAIIGFTSGAGPDGVVADLQTRWTF